MVTRPVAAALSIGVAGRYLIPRKVSSSCFAGVDWAMRWRLSAASASGESECWSPGRNRACHRSLAPWSGPRRPVAFALSAGKPTALFPAPLISFPCIEQRVLLVAALFRRRIRLRRRSGISQFRSRKEGVFLLARASSPLPREITSSRSSSISGFDQPITVINTEGWSGARLLRSISPNLRVVSGKLPHTSNTFSLMATTSNCLSAGSQCRAGPGRRGRSACWFTCVGGDGAIDRLVFPKLCGTGLTVAVRYRSGEEIAGRRSILHRNARARAGSWPLRKSASRKWRKLVGAVFALNLSLISQRPEGD